jgi:hypothetical protein
MYNYSIFNVNWSYVFLNFGMPNFINYFKIILDKIVDRK